ncbi:unnamed protein product [Polarella glacialis]|uniref:Methyltransferase type 11 domain-containing protein n=1 Tax=Polarella glacialis TaxID=89957 RepID=A0A813DYX9_POLGL|nr:unnamed protein product [Polarella glacialis]
MSSCQGNDYASPDFWDARFKDSEGMFDWYATYEELGDVFREFCPPPPSPAKPDQFQCTGHSGAETDEGDSVDSVLVVGCGNSAFSAELHAAGYRGITNIDISIAAVAKMESRFQDLGMQWQVMDATHMSFGDALFDVAVDKGTLDALMGGGSSGSETVKSMVAEVWRVLRPEGLFVLVSHNGTRLALLRAALQDAEAKEAPGAGHEAATSSGPRQRWRCLEMRRCRLSPQATLINVLRSKLQGRPLIEALRDPEILRQATIETKNALKRMQFLDAFRLFKARKKANARCSEDLSSEGSNEDADEEAKESPEEDKEDEKEPDNEGGGDHQRDAAGAKSAGASGDPRLQPYCWVYVLQKTWR